MDTVRKSTNKRRTKIVATIGPASESEEVLRQLLKEGVDIARLNFSHNDYTWHKQAIELIRKISKEEGIKIEIMSDLQGPRIRVGNSESFKIEKDEEILIINKKDDKKRNSLIIDKPGVISTFKKGDRILIEDGKIKLRVIADEDENVKARALNGGLIKPRKGINFPDTVLVGDVLTEKDMEDLKFSLQNGVDFVAFSFVSNQQEVEDLRKKIKHFYGEEKQVPQIVSKIERKEAIKNIDEIIDASDMIMVARGDLGIELPESEVIIYQKEIVTKCQEKNRPVIVATQMLESMIENPIPTRAEVSDISNAVIDRVDAVMLSGESANGKYPVEAVKMMREIIEKVEATPLDD